MLIHLDPLPAMPDRKSRIMSILFVPLIHNIMKSRIMYQIHLNGYIIPTSYSTSSFIKFTKAMSFIPFTLVYDVCPTHKKISNYLISGSGIHIRDFWKSQVLI